jgi:hypothetical protein
MLSKVWAGDKTLPLHTLVDNIVQTLSETGASAAEITTDITTTNSSGITLPTVTYFSTYKSGYDIISELSQTEYTGDNMPYIFWFDENNVFHWQYPDDTIDDTLTYGVAPVIEMSIRKAETEALSMIIYNAGSDKNGSAVVYFYLDPNAGSIKNKIKYQPMTDVSKRIRKNLEIAGTYTGMTNSAFITLLRNSAEGRCRAIIQQIGQGLWEAEVKVEGAKYNFGDFHTVTNSRNGFPATPLRINRVQHTFDKKGWQTTLTLLQDAQPLTI